MALALLSRIGAATLSVIVAALGLGVAQAPAARAASSAPVIVNLTSTEQVPTRTTREWDSANSQVTVNVANTSRISVQAGGGTTGEGFQFGLQSPAGQSLHVGSYALFETSYPDQQGYAYITVNSSTMATDETPATIDIRDLAADSDGNLTRLDVVFRFAPAAALSSAFGQLRYGETQPADHVTSATAISWPLVPAGASPVAATVWVHNLTDTTLPIGPAVLSGPDADQFALLSNGCAASGGVPAGSMCPIVVGYQPTVGGQHSARLTVPVAGARDEVDLLGPTPPGYTGLITTGDDFVDAGQTHDLPDGEYQTVLWGGPHHAIFRVDRLTDSIDFNDFMVDVSAPLGQVLTVGTHTFGEDNNANTAYNLSVSGEGRGCNLPFGTMTVKRFDVAADGFALLSADITFAVHCLEATGRISTMTGELLWRAPLTPTIFPLTGPITAYGRTVGIGGHAPAGAVVTVFAHRYGTIGYSPVATAIAGLDGRYSYSYRATADERLYGRTAGVNSTATLVQLAPTISGPLNRQVPRNHTYTITGTAAPGTIVQLHFHRAGTAPTDYSIVRNVATSAAGQWARPYLAYTDYRLYVTSTTNGTKTATYLIQAR